jgi:hypothetical protein
MPKNIYLIENKKPVELVQELEKYEIKKSPLSAAARAKVIKRNGGDYQSSRMSSEDIALMQMYGPGFWDDIKDVVKPITTGALVVASIFPPTAAIAAPVALGVVGTGAAAKGIGHLADSEGLKEFGEDLMDIGGNAQSGQSVFRTKEAPLNQYARSVNSVNRSRS